MVRMDKPLGYLERMKRVEEVLIEVMEFKHFCPNVITYFLAWSQKVREYSYRTNRYYKRNIWRREKEIVIRCRSFNESIADVLR